ncbi:helicase and polymerase-containing protein TEBICHI isoform X1 [Quercus suber]|uniref:helicase and polymerase-containing protein TEBICHI isoform X1 n=1 Tax=Quercus suber TaxID=58331 RepID=UPI0032DED309
MQSVLVDKTMGSIFGSSREVADGNGPIELQAFLKKCSNTPESSVKMKEFCTPGSLMVKACAHETPRSMCGSSVFSSEEAFWNEAIQLADSLCDPMVDISARAAEETNISKSQCKTVNSCSLRNGICHDKSKETSDKGENRVWHTELITSLGSLGKHTKDLDKEVSPLPVKHLDFSFEDKNLDESTPHCPAVDGSECASHKGGEQSECGSVGHKGLETGNTSIRCDKVQTGEEMHEGKEMTSVVAVTKRKVDLLCPNNDCMTSKPPVIEIKDSNQMTSNSPVNEVKNLNLDHKSDGASTPSSFVPLDNRLDLNRWLPSEVCGIYRKKGISKLYPWQVDCLQVDGVLQRRNLVYCASTSANKSFVAEILMLRRVISTGKIALLVLPYVSICAEKVLLEPLGKHVRSYYGNQGGGTLPKDTVVAVCTIEKANPLINRLLEEGRLSEIGIIVIDELHMVGDRNRGYLLELMLTKLRYAADEGNSESSSGESSGMSSGKADPAHGLQIVGMSATMPNVAAVADWLKAALYQTNFRPVPLEEYIKVGNTIYSKKMDIVRTISKASDLGGKDPDHIVELCNEVVQEGHSVLIFCSSRKGCELTARHVSKFLKRFSINVRNDESEFLDITSAIDALRRSPTGLDPTLEETLPSGVAYHHAGLTMWDFLTFKGLDVYLSFLKVEEREIVETCYRSGFLRVLIATSTLAAGVNLPTRRVIFRQPKIGRDFIDGTRYKQMAGRAGRTGIDTKGESVLICKPEEIKRMMGLLNESCPPLHSCLSVDMNGMTHAILEVVAGGIVQTANDIHRYVRCTLLNSTKPFEDVVKSAQESLRWLCHKKFLEWNDDTKLYSTTPLGRAAFGSSLCPEESLIVLDDLSRAREGFVLASDLHLVYLVTPINVDVEPDWELYYERFMQLSALDQSVGNRVGVVEPFLMRMAHGAPLRISKQSSELLRVCKRFYVALILSRLVQEVPVAEVCEAFKVARGMVQALQENAGRFASMVTLFCERLGWHDLEGLVAKFQNRVSFGVRAEIVELTTIPYVKGSQARTLYKAGLCTPLAIAEASVPEITKTLFESSSWATEGSAQRRVQLGVAKKIKNGARKIVLDKAEEARVAAFSAFKSLGFNVQHISQL